MVMDLLFYLEMINQILYMEKNVIDVKELENLHLLSIFWVLKMMDDTKKTIVFYRGKTIAVFAYFVHIKDIWNIISQYKIKINPQIDICNCPLCYGCGISSHDNFDYEICYHICEHCHGKGYVNFVEYFLGVK